jgi:hypothetical protein
MTMEYSLVHLVAFAIGLGFLLNGYVLVRSGREDLELFVMSVVVGGGLVFVAVYPDAFDQVATLIGLELKARAILVVSNLTLFVLVTYLLNRIGRLYDRLSKLNEEVSLLRAELEDQGTDPEDYGDD